MRYCPRFIAFSAGAVNFPWKSIAALIASCIAARHGLDVEAAKTRAMAHFRTDLYRQHLRSAGAPLPGASMRLEGALAEDRLVAAERGDMILRADGFFDGNPALDMPRSTPACHTDGDGQGDHSCHDMAPGETVGESAREQVAE